MRQTHLLKFFMAPFRSIELTDYTSRFLLIFILFGRVREVTTRSQIVGICVHYLMHE